MILASFFSQATMIYFVSKFIIWFQNFLISFLHSVVLIHYITFTHIYFSSSLLRLVCAYFDFSCSIASALLYLYVDKNWQEPLSSSLHGMRYVSIVFSDLVLTSIGFHVRVPSNDGALSFRKI